VKNRGPAEHRSIPSFNSFGAINSCKL